jgi:hypothetical protein
MHPCCLTTLMIGLLAAALTAGPPAEPAWRHITDQAFHFKVDMPCEPKLDEARLDWDMQGSSDTYACKFGPDSELTVEASAPSVTPRMHVDRWLRRARLQLSQGELEDHYERADQQGAPGFFLVTHGHGVVSERRVLAGEPGVTYTITLIRPNGRAVLGTTRHDLHLVFTRVCASFVRLGAN